MYLNKNKRTRTRSQYPSSNKFLHIFKKVYFSCSKVTLRPIEGFA